MAKIRRTKSNHTWFVFESMGRRISKSLSDLDGTDAYIHGGKPTGVFRELGNALVRSADQPTVAQMKAIYKNIKVASPLIMKNAGSRSLFDANAFKQLVVTARKYAEISRASPNFKASRASGRGR